jgi:hypothetical protein
MLTLLLMSILALAFKVQPVEAGIGLGDPRGIIKIVPSSVVGFCPSDLYPGPNNTKFDVEVIIGNITNCVGYGFRINYNSTLLKLDSWIFDTDPANPMSPTQIAPSPFDRIETISSTPPGSVQLATVWKYPGPEPYNCTVDSVAARLTFQIVQIPPPLIGENNTVSTLIALERTHTFWYYRLGSMDYIMIFFIAYSNGYYEYTTRERLVGDVDGDRDVDVGDQRQVQLAMFTLPGDSPWNPNADIDYDLSLDVGDQRKQQLHMFESW